MIKDTIESNLRSLDPKLIEAINGSRKSEIGVIEQALLENKIVLINGPARAGKTTLSRFLLNENHLSEQQKERDIAWIPFIALHYISTDELALADLLLDSEKIRICLDEALTWDCSSTVVKKDSNTVPVISKIIKQSQSLQAQAKIELIINGLGNSEENLKKVIASFPEGVGIEIVNLYPRE